MKKFKNLSNLALHVTDLQRSLEFYKKLGCEHVFTYKLPDGRDERACLRVCEGQYLEMFQIYEDHPTMPRTGISHKPNDSFAHFSFLVPDMYHTASEWGKQGIRVVYAPFKPDPYPLEKDEFKPFTAVDRNKVVWLEDPDGNWIEIIEQLEDSWQKVFEGKNPYR